MKKFDLNSGALAPVKEELSIDIVPFDGEIPPQVRGTFFRNGPNPFSGIFNGDTMLDWWPEASMVHAVQFAPGSEKPIRYKNRWLRTSDYQNFHGGMASNKTVPTNPNVSVLNFGGQLIALGEGLPPMEIGTSLEQNNVPRMFGSLLEGMTAHPKIDFTTGELVWFHASPASDRIRYGVNDRHGRNLVDIELSLPSPVFMHDFAITASKSIIFDASVVLDLELAMAGDPFPISWNETKTSRLGVLPRMGGDVSWFKIEPCFLQHVANAYDQGDYHIVLDAIRYPFFLKRCNDTNELVENPLGELWRYEIDLQTGRVREYPQSNRSLEFPQINQKFCGQRHHYIYLAEQTRDDEIRGLVKLDVETGRTTTHQIPEGDQNGEPIFVQGESKDEDDGFILLPVFRGVKDTTDLLILDAQNLSGDPIAIANLPCRIPAGFHSLWVSD